MQPSQKEVCSDAASYITEKHLESMADAEQLDEISGERSR
jgi:hypothetical protein